MKNKNITMIKLLITILSLYIPMTACSDDDKMEQRLEDQPVLITSYPEMNTKISPATEKIKLVFDRGVVVKEIGKIAINDTVAIAAKVKDKEAILSIPALEEDKEYTLTIKKGAIMANIGITNQEDIVINFSTSTGSELTVVSSNPEENATLSPRSVQLDIFFDQQIRIEDTLKIKLNGAKLQFKPYSSQLKLSTPLGHLEENTAYTLTIEQGAISTSYGRLNSKPISLKFRTDNSPLTNILIAQNASQQAQNVYKFLLENFGEKTISGTMANVSWNTNEAEWVYKHTGKYPALNAFDYIHANGNWVDYTNIKVVQDWWNKNGLVSIGWHWNVPKTIGSSEYAFYTKETDFDINKALQEGTAENVIIKADLDKVANYLLLLQQANIPVLWRPLHEAAGAWFWWGAKGAEPCKELWKFMFETFENKGLNNLIWVWTAEAGDTEWYPGDEYVDIIGRDIYNKMNANDMQGEYNDLVLRFPNKVIALSEMGSVANVAEQLDNGTMWSWAMPWYDFDRTKDINNGSFAQAQHMHADILFWQKMINHKKVITRDQMPSLK